MSRRVTVKDLRAEAKARLADCRGGKQLSKLNKTELLKFLECIDDMELAQEYKRQEAARQGRKRVVVDSEVSLKPRRKKAVAAKPAAAAAPQKRKRSRKLYNPSFDGDAPEDGGFQLYTDKSGRSYGAEKGTRKLGGSGMTYRQFVQQRLPEARASGLSSTDAMRDVAAQWQEHKQKGGGRRADAVGSAADAFATGAAAAGVAQPEFAPVLEPLAAAAKGVGWAAKLF